MSLQRFSPSTHKAEADRTLAPTYTSNVITPPSHTLSGRDSVRQPETEASLTDTLGVAEKSPVTTPNYSKRLSGPRPNSHLWEFC